MTLVAWGSRWKGKTNRNWIFDWRNVGWRDGKRPVLRTCLWHPFHRTQSCAVRLNAVRKCVSGNCSHRSTTQKASTYQFSIHPARHRIGRRKRVMFQSPNSDDQGSTVMIQFDRKSWREVRDIVPQANLECFLQTDHWLSCCIIQLNSITCTASQTGLPIRKVSTHRHASKVVDAGCINHWSFDAHTLT